MGVDFYPCSICGEVECDAGFMEHCSKCHGIVFECCYEEQEKKYGLARDKKTKDYYGKAALKECDNCSKAKKADRIAALKKKLAEEENS